MTNALVYVIVQTKNRYTNLKEAIDSILIQTYKNTEVIVVDDCSDDNISKQVYQIKLLYYVKYSK